MFKRKKKTQRNKCHSCNSPIIVPEQEELLLQENDSAKTSPITCLEEHEKKKKGSSSSLQLDHAATVLFSASMVFTVQSVGSLKGEYDILSPVVWSNMHPEGIKIQLF